MFHPLAPNLTSLKDEELNKKVAELLQRMTFAQRTGNFQMLSQLQTLYYGYQEESQRRAQQWLDKVGKKKKNNDDESPNYDIG
jgi:hypothetical protein